MKTCYSCKKEKDESWFNWRNKASGIRQGFCRDCKKKYQKKYYDSSKQAYIATILKTRKIRLQKAIERWKPALSSNLVEDISLSS